ncbi:AMIN-like domain-containing (lipo)protein [Oerskovia flava]|uniref:AMIN-like domain-containing (lipo)protein n=1 Tax=Oerskovia flava TaxID=2986422 RepID=UPI00223F6939|nr:hypothetical protein [Oerskovia sp. JB1-3-2]
MSRSGLPRRQQPDTRGSTRRPGTAGVAITVAALLTAAACAGGDGPADGAVTSTGESSPTEATTTPSDDETSTEPTADSPDDATDDGTDELAPAPVPFPADASPDTQDPSSDAMLTVTDIRLGYHDDFERVVFELGGTGTPGWRVEYVDEPADDGTGSPVEVDGDAFLQVMISGSAYPMDSGVEEYAGENPLRSDELDEIEEVLLRGVFEGYTQAFIGVDDDDRPAFRVFALEDPVRVVVDVRDD